jgi:predicted SnoaL-like aldol condensation-catalyzing enzyme
LDRSRGCIVTGIRPRNGIWFPDCGGDPQPGVAEFHDLGYRDSTEATNAATVRAFFEKVWNGRDTAAVNKAIDALVDPSYRRYYEAKLLQGRDQFKVCVREMHASHPELYVTVLRIIPSYNFVGASIHIRWVTDSSYEMRGIEMYRLHNDLIAESWHTMERAGSS